MPFGGNEWLALTSEPTVEPEMPIQMAGMWCNGFDSDARGERAFSSTLIQALPSGPVRRHRPRRRTGRGAPDGVDARLVPLRDAFAIVDAVLALRDDPAARHRMGARARAFAEAHFSLSQLDRGLADLLARVTSPGPGAKRSRPLLGR